ncbi:sensor histidine kinase [Ningiella sp. W23]|uniref:sensor histidine kinase n=1 Tax=Ningiella sp. W23 TaxID=3023715 RepID=UPI003756BA1A
MQSLASDQACAMDGDIDDEIFKEITDLSNDYIYIKNSRGEVVFANQATRTLLQSSIFERSEQVASLSDRICAFFEHKSSSPHKQQIVVEAQRHALTKGEHSRVESFQLGEHSDRVFQINVKRFGAYRDDAHLLIVAKDITEQELIVQDLKRSNKDLDSFAYVASHDLKAPLNVIKRMVSWVMEDCETVLPRDSMENLEIVMSRVHRMEQLLQDLLSYSKIGREYQHPSEVNVNDKVVELLSLIDLPMGFSLRCDDVSVLVPDVPFSVVLLNLISNAIKHNDSGNAKIQIKVKRKQTSNMITVMDNGPGISEGDRARIFDLFETLKPRDEVEGSGMGLSIVKRLVEHYGGSITIQDNTPRGAKFVINWPLNNLTRQAVAQLSC